MVLMVLWRLVFAITGLRIVSPSTKAVVASLRLSSGGGGAVTEEGVITRCMVIYAAVGWLAPSREHVLLVALVAVVGKDATRRVLRLVMAAVDTILSAQVAATTSLSVDVALPLLGALEVLLQVQGARIVVGVAVATETARFWVGLRLMTGGLFAGILLGKEALAAVDHRHHSSLEAGWLESSSTVPWHTSVVALVKASASALYSVITAFGWSSCSCLRVLEIDDSILASLRRVWHETRCLCWRFFRLTPSCLSGSSTLLLAIRLALIARDRLC